MITCTRCQRTGFLNIEQLEGDAAVDLDIDDVLKWIATHDNHDVQVCDCCGDGEGWYGVPGEHYHRDDPPGPNGPYASNGGLCKCH